MISALSDRVWLDHHYTELAMSDRQIANLLGVPQHRVYSARQRLDIRSRPRGHNLKSDSGLRPDQIRAAVAQSRKRDGYRCRRCGSGDKMETHHERPVELYPELIDDVDNMITLCGKCHRWVHSKRNVYGVFLRGIREC